MSTATKTIIPPKIFHITIVSLLWRIIENNNVMNGSMYRNEATFDDFKTFWEFCQI